MSRKSKAREINDKRASFVSGGMPNPNSMSKEQWEEWKRKHPPEPSFFGSNIKKNDSSNKNT